MSGMNPLRVLVAGPTYTVGVNQAKLAALAAVPGVSVGVLAPEAWTIPEWRRTVPLERPYPALAYFPSPIRFGSRRGAHLYDAGVVRAALREFRPDLLWIELESFSLGAFQLSRLARASNVKTGLFCWENTDRFLWPPRRLTRRLTLRGAACAVAGNDDAAALLRRWGFTGPLEVMPQMGVDPAFFAPRPAPPPPPFVAGFLGRLVREKGVDVLLEAVRRVRASGIDIRAEICGGGPAEADLRSSAAAGVATWRPGVAHEDVPAVLAGWHALVMPSRTVPGWKEQFGHALIEAMAMRIPVLGSDCGEIPRVIGRDDAVFPEGDAGALAAKLSRLAGDPAWRVELADAGERRVRERYTHDRIAARLAAFWRGAIGP